MGIDGSERRELELRLERTLPLAQATVYETLTHSTKLATWWRPTDFTVPNAAFEPRVGSGPDPDDRETLVTISLIDRGPETGLRLVQSGFATEARYALMETLERLDRFLRRGEQA